MLNLRGSPHQPLVTLPFFHRDTDRSPATTPGWSAAETTFQGSREPDTGQISVTHLTTLCMLLRLNIGSTSPGAAKRRGWPYRGRQKGSIDHAQPVQHQTGRFRHVSRSSATVPPSGAAKPSGVSATILAWSASQPTCPSASNEIGLPSQNRPSVVPSSNRFVSQLSKPRSATVQTHVPAGQASAAEPQSVMAAESPNLTEPLLQS
jgi:hypothetical protein